MPTLDVYNSNKEKVGQIEVSDTVFGVEVKSGLIQEVVRWQMARRRQGTACTKNRSEVSGSGRKPFRQKGTGRARAGSNTSPLWKRGGTVFGPKPRDYSYSLPKKVRKLGLRMALSGKVKDSKLWVLRDFGLEQIKTKEVVSILKRFGIEKAVIITSGSDEKLEKSARNIPYVKVLRHEGLNVYDLVRYSDVLIHEPAMELIEKRLQS
ncbi:LSU ribosomal protein L4p (L1e) [Dissulfuribacter thermophilus]|uniref:Large ribosomal subunit protein uL4 n=1 Tax=Dissulfuribacter thermophilus TaxID=1156395 RepID=A0A1B9F514_9BACT|nr:50S ribosomal protein L4 [Dissulfuribacter thermophilus]OCC15049.1 LSU ribosomal protein L4p (L1e) [Dissulfuribacter thermophilus]